jgi:hypothetical protein
MGWNPNNSKRPTADALVDLLDGAPWGKITAILVTRLSKEGAVELGWQTPDKDDTPSTVTKQISEAANEDAEEAGGRFKYRVTVRGMKKPPGKNQAEVETTLFVHTFDMGKGDPSETGGATMLKEASAFVRAQAEAGERNASAIKTMSEVQVGVLQAQGAYMSQLMEIGDKRNSVGPHHVRMLEIQMEENQRLRDREDERSERREERASEDASDMRRAQIINSAGSKLSSWGDRFLPAILPGIVDNLKAAAFKKNVDAAIRAKEAGINFGNAPEPTPTPTPSEPASEPEPKKATVIQISQLAKELDDILGGVSEENIAAIEEAVGSNIWDLLVAAGSAKTIRSAEPSCSTSSRTSCSFRR